MKDKGKGRGQGVKQFQESITAIGKKGKWRDQTYQKVMTRKMSHS